MNGAPPIRPNPRLSNPVSRGGPRTVPLPAWLKGGRFLRRAIRHRRACRLYRRLWADWQVGRRAIPAIWQDTHPVELGRVRRDFFRQLTAQQRAWKRLERASARMIAALSAVGVTTAEVAAMLKEESDE